MSLMQAIWYISLYNAILRGLFENANHLLLGTGPGVYEEGR